MADYAKTVVGQLTALISLGGGVLLLAGTIEFFFRAYFMQFPGGPTLANLPTSQVILTGATTVLPAFVLAGLACFIWSHSYDKVVTGAPERAFRRSVQHLWPLALLLVVAIPVAAIFVFRAQEHPPPDQIVQRIYTWQLVPPLILLGALLFLLASLVVRLFATRRISTQQKRGVVIPVVLVAFTFAITPPLALLAATVQFPLTAICTNGSMESGYAIQSTSTQVFVGVLRPDRNFVLVIPQSAITRQAVGTSTIACPPASPLRLADASTTR